MPIDPRIPLAGRVPGIQVPDFAGIRDRRAAGQRQDDLLDLQRQRFAQQQAAFQEGAPARQQQAANAREEMRIRSVVAGAALAKPFLDSGNIEGARAVGMRRLAQLEELGFEDDAQTREFLSALDADPTGAQARALVDSVIAGGERLGILDRGKLLTEDELTQQLALREAEAGAKTRQQITAGLALARGKAGIEEASPLGQAELAIKEAQVQERQQDIAAADRQLDAAAQVRQDALDLVGSLLSPEREAALAGTTGTIQGALPAVSEEKIDIREDIKTLQAQLTSENLKLLSGVLSDSDINLLARIAAGGLNLRSEAGVRRNLARIQSKLQAAVVPSAAGGGAGAGAEAAPERRRELFDKYGIAP